MTKNNKKQKNFVAKQETDQDISSSANSAAPSEKLGNFSGGEKITEIGGPKGPEPTRYNDWEVNGRVSDF